MLVKTTRFGELEVDESKVLFFPAGLPGLPGSRRYLLLDIAEQRPFRWLQSCDEPEIALVVVDPLLFFPDYRVEVSLGELNALGLEVEAEDECEVLVVLVVPPDPRLITANLLAPVIINHRRGRGVQVILSNSPYTTRHYLFRAAPAEAGADAAKEPAPGGCAQPAGAVGGPDGAPGREAPAEAPGEAASGAEGGNKKLAEAAGGPR